MPIDGQMIAGAHRAMRSIGGVTLTIDGGGDINAVVVSEDTPIVGSGLVDGYDDERRMIEVAVLVADQTTAPEPGSVVTVSTRSDVQYQIVPGSVVGTIADWRFGIVEAQDVLSGTWDWADGTPILWEDSAQIETESN